EREPADGVGGREVLRDRDERGARDVEALHHFGEVQERSAEAGDLVNDDHVDLAGVDVGEQPLERGAIQILAAEAAVVVARADELPALVRLRAHVLHARLTLRVEGVELLLEPLRDALACVDRAPDRDLLRRALASTAAHRSSTSSSWA